MLLLLAAAKQVGLRCPRHCKVDCAAAWQGTGWEIVLSIGGVSAFDAWWHANSPLLGATICPLGV